MKTRSLMIATTALALTGMAGSAFAEFEASHDSLTNYCCPEWFRDAKFGIWSHWGPQAVPMAGDWYARNMYIQGHRQYEHHLKHFGHPTTNGWKDICVLWKAEKFDPDRLMTLYKAAGAKYFVSMGVHHDAFFLWDTTNSEWNAVQKGPRRDIVAAWQAAAKKQGLPFGVSEHLAASWRFYRPAHGSDKTGPLAGVPYDAADPKWASLYHKMVATDDWYTKDPSVPPIWGAFINELIDKYHPDLLYSDGGLPFGPQVGYRTIAHLYNDSAAFHGGQNQAVYCLKSDEPIGVSDVERGSRKGIQPRPWQSDTSIGDWFYDEHQHFRDTGWVIHTLADVVSKNGNLLINMVQRPDGSLNPEVEQMLGELAAWMPVNGEAIFATRPWETFGEGPRTNTRTGSFYEESGYTAEDVRFTCSKDGRFVYALFLGVPQKDMVIRAFAKKPGHAVAAVTLLGSTEKLVWRQDADGLAIQKPASFPTRFAVAFKLTLAK